MRVFPLLSPVFILLLIFIARIGAIILFLSVRQLQNRHSPSVVILKFRRALDIAGVAGLKAIVIDKQVTIT
jgi:hypothetical protein